MIDAIRKKINQDKFEFSKHAVDQSILRNIRVDEIRQTMQCGEIIEDYPHDKYGPSCLILGFTNNERPLHIQCSYPSREMLKIITVYQPSRSDWLDFRIRRRP